NGTTAGNQTLTLAPNTNLLFNQSISVHIVGTSTGADRGTITNTAHVTATGEDSNFFSNNTATASITVNNTPPTAVDDSYNTPFNTPLTVSAPGVLANDTDLNGDSLTVTANSSPGHGSVTIGSNGGFTYTPTTGFAGPTDSFTYTISDGHGG